MRGKERSYSNTTMKGGQTSGNKHAIGPVDEENTGKDKKEKGKGELSVGSSGKEAVRIEGCEEGAQMNVCDIRLTTTDTVVIEAVSVGVQMYRQRFLFSPTR